MDFQSLVLICDMTNDQDRLDHYIKKFESHNFSQFAINWHLRQNRQGEVFERFKGNQAALSQFMRDHPTLGWIQLVFNGYFERAAKILFQLAQNETEFVQRKKVRIKTVFFIFILLTNNMLLYKKLNFFGIILSVSILFYILF